MSKKGKAKKNEEKLSHYILKKVLLFIAIFVVIFSVLRFDNYLEDKRETARLELIAEDIQTQIESQVEEQKTKLYESEIKTYVIERPVYLDKGELNIVDFQTSCFWSYYFDDYRCDITTFNLTIIGVYKQIQCITECPSNETLKGCTIEKCRKEIDKGCINFDFSNGYNYFESYCDEDIIEVDYKYSVELKY